MDSKQHIIVESDNEESHNRSSRADSAQQHRALDGHKVSITSPHQPAQQQSDRGELIQPFDQACTPVTQGNKFSFMDRDINNDNGTTPYFDPNPDGQQHSFAGQSSACGPGLPWSQRNSRDQHNMIEQDFENGVSQDFSCQKLPLQPESRNLDKTGLGGQSAGVYGPVPDSGTLKQVAREVPENFRSQTTHPLSRVLAHAQGEPLEQHGTMNHYQTGSSTCLRATPSKILQIQTTKAACSRLDEEDDDEPSLQSPAPQMIRQIERQAIREESEACSPDEFARAAVEQQAPSPALSPAEPQPEALSVTKSEKAEPMPALHSPVLPSKKEQDHVKDSHYAHLTESPSLPTRHGARKDQNERNGCSNSPDYEAELLNRNHGRQQDRGDSSSKVFDRSDDDYGSRFQMMKNHTATLHRSDCKQNVTRRILDINVQDYNHTAKLGKGLFALEGIGEASYHNGQLSDSKTAREMVSSSMQARSKSHNNKSPFGTAMTNAPAELQAHIDRLRMRSSLQHPQLPFHQAASSLSPFQKGAGQVQPQFESLYQMQLQQNGLSTFDAQSQYSAALRSGNPLAQSMNQLNQFGLTQQQMLRASTKQSQMDAESQGGGLMLTAHQQAPTVGHQYEVLLKERADLTEKVEELQGIIDAQRKQMNQLKSQQTLLKFDIDERNDDLEDMKQNLQDKDKMIADLKDTLRRQNEQIDQFRDDLTRADRREREIRQTNDTSQKKIHELQAQIQKQFQEYKLIAKDGGDHSLDHKHTEMSHQMQQKSKELYQLTVELGSLREENNELRKNVEQQKEDFQERLKEQRDRHETEFNKVIDELELLKIESDERIEASQKTIEEQIQKIKDLESQMAEHDQKTQDLDCQLTAKKQEFSKKQELCDLQQEEISSLTKNYQLLNEQLDELQEQLNESNKRQENSHRQGGFMSNYHLDEDKTISGQGKPLLSGRSRERAASNEQNSIRKSNNNDNSSMMSDSPKRQLDRSPEIIGAKPGKITEQTRQKMIMSSQEEIDQPNQREDMEDGIYTAMNLSTLDDMGLESRRNPIDTEISRQQVDDGRRSLGQVDDGRRSLGYQDSMQNELMRDNGNHQSDYPDGHTNPLFYDSLQDNPRQSATQISNVSSRGGGGGAAHHQLIARGSQNSMEWQRCQSHQSNGVKSVPSAQGQFQTTQQPSNRNVFEEKQNSIVHGQFSHAAARSPVPPATIYQQFRKNHSKLSAMSHMRMSNSRPSIQSTRNNNSSMQGMVLHSQFGENSDIGTRLITQRKKQKQNVMLNTSQSTAAINVTEVQAPQTQRAHFGAKSSSNYNPLSVSRGSGIGNNSGLGLGLGQPGKSLGQRVMNNCLNQTMAGQNLQPNASGHKLLQQQQQAKTRPSMMLGPNQTKAGLTPAQPQLAATGNTLQGCRSTASLVNQEIAHSKFGQTAQFSNSSANCKTARQFLQRSPVPTTTVHHQQQQAALQSARGSQVGQSQPTMKTVAQQQQQQHQQQMMSTQQSMQQLRRDSQQSAGKIVKNKEAALNSVRRACRSQRVPDYRKKLPSRHEVATKPGRQEIGSSQVQANNDDRYDQAFTDASNRQMGQTRYNLRTIDQTEHQLNQLVDANGDNAHGEEIAKPQKENCWMGLDASPTENLDKTCKPNEVFQNALDISGNADSYGEQTTHLQMGQFKQMHTRYQLDTDRGTGAATSRGPVTTIRSGSTTPRDGGAAATARAYRGGGGGEYAQDTLRKGNMNEMRMKLQSIQTGKAYLEKKIQEYESRLNQMKVKKDRHSRQQNRMKNI